MYQDSATVEQRCIDQNSRKQKRADSDCSTSSNPKLMETTLLRESLEEIDDKNIYLPESELTVVYENNNQSSVGKQESGEDHESTAEEQENVEDNQPALKEQESGRDNQSSKSNEDGNSTDEVDEENEAENECYEEEFYVNDDREVMIK